jgi:hypothetical protein
VENIKNTKDNILMLVTLPFCRLAAFLREKNEAQK